MEPFRFSEILREKRAALGLTQQQVADHIGVSKASVSKWESGRGYPDLFFLPPLASLFSLSVDDLLGYAPQLDRGEIRRHYKRLAALFTTGPFEMALAETQKTIKLYYACHPLLLQMAGLLLNHLELAPAAARQPVLEEVRALCRRVRQQSGRQWQIHHANVLEAYVELLQGRPQALPALLAPEPGEGYAGEDALLAQAYLQMGQADEAEQTVQAGMYQALVQLLALGAAGLSLPREPAWKEKTIWRLLAVADAFQIEGHFSSAYINLLYAAAVFWAEQAAQEAPAPQGGEKEERVKEETHQRAAARDNALWVLEKAVEAVGSLSNSRQLQGDTYFDKLENWFARHLDLGTELPKSPTMAAAGFCEALQQDPALAGLRSSPRFRQLLARCQKQARPAKKAGENNGGHL